MAVRDIPEPLRQILSTVFDVHALGGDWNWGLRCSITAEPGWADLFRQQFGDAILHNSISVEDYKELTNHPMADRAELNEFLRSKWKQYYGYHLTGPEYVMSEPPEPEENREEE